MKIPLTTVVVSLPEEFGIIKNVRAIVKTRNKTFSICCGAEPSVRYHSLDGIEWPKIFDSNLKPIVFHILNNDEPNTSVFEGIYTMDDETYDEAYLEGDLHFIFDIWKDEHLSTNYSTSSIHFSLDAEDYYDLLEMFKKQT